ncbi:hypothetical protein [Streptomyces sp. CC208A]|uniref:hypothetical protein n=1 Tax=Streptomyces sp. CC208A TaxID=3044573 RepID=UPI0024A8355D|nr:hypothetical protein [Streptomyces sp. CC208A]
MTVPRPPGGDGIRGGASGGRIVQNVYAFDGFAYGAINADVHVHGDGRPVYLLAEHEPPSGDPDPAWIEQPSRLLNAGNVVVPFTGREAELRELARWSGPGSGGRADGGNDNGGAPAVRWLHGPGGRGKTRLAGHFAAHSARQGWKTIVVRHGGTVLAESAGSHDARTGNLRGLLVLVDYADRWPLRDLAWLFANSMFDGGTRTDDRGRRVPVRVLLPARTAHAWPAVKSMIGDRAATSERELAALPEELAGREGVFAAARTRFAEPYGRPDAAAAPSAVPLADPAFGLTLTVHMAALVAVDAHVHGRTPARDPAGLSAYLLEREHENWRRLYENGAAGLDFRTAPDDMASVAFVAALTGATTWEEAAAVLERAGVATAPETVRSLLRAPPAGPAGHRPRRGQRRSGGGQRRHRRRQRGPCGHRTRRVPRPGRPARGRTGLLTVGRRPGRGAGRVRPRSPPPGAGPRSVGVRVRQVLMGRRPRRRARGSGPGGPRLP